VTIRSISGLEARRIFPFSASLFLSRCDNQITSSSHQPHLQPAPNVVL
jgi:hypothetical protein